MAQVIMFAFIPIITRLYSPEEFGLYSLFFSITTAIALISSLNYEQAIVLPKSEKDAQALVFLSGGILFSVVSITTILTFVFYDLLLEYFQGMEYFIWLLPISVLILGFQQIFDQFSNRKNFYKKMATAKVISSVGTVSTQMSSRYIFGLNGLVFGKVFADLLGVIFLYKHHIKEQTLHLRSMSKKRVIVNARRHDHFPRYQTGTSLINYLAQYLPIFLFPMLFSPEAAGYYALAFRILMVPTTIMGGSVRSVYYQKASRMFNNNENIYSLYKKTTLGLLKIYIVPFLVIVIFGKEIFTFLFGEQWGMSGEIAQLMVFTSLLAFINIPSVMTFNILKLQKLQLFLQILQFFLRGLAIYIGYYIFNSYLGSITLYVLVTILNNMFLIYYINKKLKIRS
jgi:O-antigen/teichoic acid export membrane protein